jgi:hypothetical protein
VTDMNEAIRRRLAGRSADELDRRTSDPAPSGSRPGSAGSAGSRPGSAGASAAPVVPGGVRSTAATDRPAVTLGDVIRGHLAAEAERRGGHVRAAHADRTARRSVDEDEA